MYIFSFLFFSLSFFMVSTENFEKYRKKKYFKKQDLFLLLFFSSFFYVFIYFKANHNLKGGNFKW